MVSYNVLSTDEVPTATGWLLWIVHDIHKNKILTQFRYFADTLGKGIYIRNKMWSKWTWEVYLHLAVCWLESCYTGSLHSYVLRFLTSVSNMFLEWWFCVQSTFMVGWTFCCFMDPNTKINFTQYFTPKYYYKLNIIIDGPIHCRLKKRFFTRPVRTSLLEKNYWCGMVILIIYSWEYQSVWRMTKTAHMRPVPNLKI